MKLVTAVGAAVAALACVGFLAAAQGVLRRGSPPGPATLWPASMQTNALVLPLADAHSPFPALAAAGEPAFRVQTFPPSARVQPPSTAPTVLAGVYPSGRSNLIAGPAVRRTVPPGVYKTEPYSCIVVVPGPHPDDRCIVNPGIGNYSIPVIKPDLRFIPLAPAQK